MPYIIAGLNFQTLDEPIFLGPFDTKEEANRLMNEHYQPLPGNYVDLPEGKEAFHVYFLRPPFDGWTAAEKEAWKLTQAST